MKVALMDYEGKLHKFAEWNGQSEHKGMYLRFPNDPLVDHYTAVLAIRPEDVDEYSARCADALARILAINSELNQFKTAMHHKLIPFDK